MVHAQMPFGKHRGQLLSSVPGDYLRWVLTCTNLWPQTRSAVEDELDRRACLLGRWQPSPATTGSTNPSVDLQASGPTVQVAGVRCSRCGCARLATSWQKFTSNIVHVRAVCAGCGAFVRFLPKRFGPAAQQHEDACQVA
jgi:hypothetical protein